MFARVTVSQVSPKRVDESIRYAREQIIPKAKAMTGFKAGYWLADRKTGKGVTITLWETEAAERASQATAGQIREQVQKAFGTQMLSVEAYEVAAQA